MPDAGRPAGPVAEPPTGRRTPARRPAWQRVLAQLVGIGALFAVGFSMLWYGSADIQPLPPPPVDPTLEHPPVLVEPDSRLPGVLVPPPPREPGAPDLTPPGEPGREIPGTDGTTGPLPPTGAGPRVAGKRHPVFDFDFGIEKPLLLRRRLPVQITMYCLKGTTRSGLPTRPGIVAADPRVLPIGTTIDLYVGLKYYGRYLVDDTGGVIKGAIIDVWTPECKDARRFGRRRGAVVLVTPRKQRRR